MDVCHFQFVGNIRVSFTRDWAEEQDALRLRYMPRPERIRFASMETLLISIARTESIRNFGRERVVGGSPYTMPSYAAFFSGTQLTTAACSNGIHRMHKRATETTQIQRQRAEGRQRPSKWYENGQKYLTFIGRFAFIHSSWGRSVCAFWVYEPTAKDMFLNLSEMCSMPTTTPGNTTTQFFSVCRICCHCRYVWHIFLAHFLLAAPVEVRRRATHLI